MRQPNAILDRLFTPVDASSLGLFRICFGATMAWQLTTLMPYFCDSLVYQKFFITYDFFHWVRILPRPAMVVIFNVLLAASALLAIGLFTRTATAVLFVGWSYLFLLCRGHYNNHYYLYVLLAFLLLFMNANRWASVDRRLGIGGAQPASVPIWQVWLLRAQIVVVYFYGGVAKLAPDWLRGYPMKIWLERKAATDWAREWLATDAAAYVFSYGGLVFDLFVGFMLLSTRWRWWALPFLLFFHLTNAWLWEIGTFPWFMLAATSLFFDPDWPRRAFGGAPRVSATTELRQRRGLVVAGLAIYLAWQILFPLRLHLYPGNPAWHGQGNLFAWRMLLVNRGVAVRVAVALPGEGTVGYVKMEEYVNRRQFVRMTRTPKAYVRFAHYLRGEIEAQTGRDDAAVHVHLKRQLNERPFQYVFDPERNLAAEPYYRLRHATYIVPLDPALRPGTAPPLDPTVGDGAGGELR